MARRRRRSGRLVEILESASLGPKRAIVVAQLGDEILVLGSSEGGIALLSTRPAAGLASQLRSAGARPPSHDQGFGAGARPQSPESRAGARPPPQSAKGRVLDLLSRIRPRTRPAPTFETALTESLEDLELRRKLAAGLAGQAGRPPPGSVP